MFHVWQESFEGAKFEVLIQGKKIIVVVCWEISGFEGLLSLAT